MLTLANFISLHNSATQSDQRRQSESYDGACYCGKVKYQLRRRLVRNVSNTPAGIRWRLVKLILGQMRLGSTGSISIHREIPRQINRRILGDSQRKSRALYRHFRRRTRVQSLVLRPMLRLIVEGERNLGIRNNHVMEPQATLKEAS